MKKQLILIALRFVLWQVVLLWCKTLSIKKLNGDKFEGLKQSGKKYVVAFWHGSMFVGWFLHRPVANENVSALVSQSNDGEYLATILERWKYSMIRGSSHIGGKEAMQLMVDAVTNGSSLAITPDGPRGPRHEMKMGAIRVAQKTGVPLIVCGIAMKKKKHLRSWDKFEVPLPFSSVVVKYSDPIFVPVEFSGDLLDRFKNETESNLRLLCVDAENVA